MNAERMDPKNSVPQSSPASAGHDGDTGLILRQTEPLNLEFPFEKLDHFLTPTDLFYIRNHFRTPRVDDKAYRLRVDGAVQNPFTLDLDEIRSMPRESQVATLECAGNSRVFLHPQADGVQWELGAVGNAEWSGVPLSSLLDRAALNDDACDVVLEGLDRGQPSNRPKPAGDIAYARSITIEKALEPEVLIAYEMNGEPLSPDHGFPVRAIVPGHYAMASVKWLIHVHVVGEPFQGYWQTSDYAYWAQENGNPVRRALSEMRVKAAIARPGLYEVIPAGRAYRVLGAAWSGCGEVAAVELTTDSGESWIEAEFLDPVRPFAWRRWKWDWHTPQRTGRYTLMARARDSTGAMQPQERDPNYGGYAVHHVLPIEVFVQ